MSRQDLFFDDPAASASPAAASPGSGLASTDANAPLAELLRPRHIDDVIGQAHLLGPGKPLRVAFEQGRLHSMILWGPPGVGKTTLARLLAGAVQARLIVLSAVLAGVKEIREAVIEAEALRRRGQRTILFVDEVHRFNKSQQDAFLPHVESGLFTFIGATTENPSFEVNSALLSRATVHVLKSLAPDALSGLLARARELMEAPALSAAAAARLVAHADGDARRLLNTYENLIASLGRTGRDGGAADGNAGEAIGEPGGAEEEDRERSVDEEGVPGVVGVRRRSGSVEPAPRGREADRRRHHRQEALVRVQVGPPVPVESREPQGEPGEGHRDDRQGREGEAGTASASAAHGAGAR